MPRVLIVDEDMRGSPSLTMALQLEGIEVDFAQSAAQALHDVEGALPDLVVIDLMMRESSGLQLAREIKRRFPSVRTVLTSAYPLGASQLERLDCGVIGFVPKPYDFGDVVDFLRAKASTRSVPVALSSSPESPDFDAD
jgi:two-component system response regulator TrcR